MVKGLCFHLVDPFNVLNILNFIFYYFSYAYYFMLFFGIYIYMFFVFDVGKSKLMGFHVLFREILGVLFL